MTPAAVLFAVSLEGGTGEQAEPPSEPPNIVVPVAHSFALMTVMRISEAVLWPEPFGRPHEWGDHMKEAFTKPPIFDTSYPFLRWDHDTVFVNVVGHGLFGSELYLRARQCHFGWAGSLAFAAATSAVWEFGIEASGARPSAQDLVYTPLMGMGLGELRYLLHRVGGKAVKVLVDPFGELERAAGTHC